MANKIVIDIETLERQWTVAEWEDMARACEIAANAFRGASKERAAKYDRLSAKAKHRADMLLLGRVLG